MMYWKEIQNQIIVISPSGEITSLQEVAADIWRLHSAGETIEGIEQKIAQMYDADPEQIKQDVASFMMQVQEKGLDKETHDTQSSHIMTWLLHLPLPNTLKAYILLHRIQQQLSTYGLFAIVRELATIEARYIAHRADVERLEHAITFAASTLLFKTGCLQQYLALCFLLRMRQVKADIVLGVTLYPFASHAWAICNGQPIAWKVGMGMDTRRERLKDYAMLFTTDEEGGDARVYSTLSAW